LQHQQGGGAGHGRTPQLRNLTIDYWYDQSVAEKTEKKIKKKKKLLSIILPRRPMDDPPRAEIFPPRLHPIIDHARQVSTRNC